MQRSSWVSQLLFLSFWARPSLRPAKSSPVGSKVLQLLLLSSLSHCTCQNPPPQKKKLLLCVLSINAITYSVSSINNWTKERKFRELTEESRKDVQVQVVRDNIVAPLSAFQILVGDIIELSTGNGVPGDGLYITGILDHIWCSCNRFFFFFFCIGTDLEADESAMTGESLPVRKSADMPYMLSGCNISDGNGRMVITAVGPNSEWGRTMSKLAVEMEDTPMQVALEDLAAMVGWIGIGVAGLVFMLLTLYWVIDVATEDAFYRWCAVN